MYTYCKYCAQVATIVYGMSTPSEALSPSSVPAGLRRRLAPDGLDLLFREARSHKTWHPIPVPDALLREVYELARLGPTSNNGCPARFLFLRTPEAKERLRPAVSPGNIGKVLAAPVVAIVGYDLAFFEHLPQLFAHREVASCYRQDPVHAQVTAFRNGSLQGAYLMMAARALGLDCGPMSGFDHHRVDELFFAGTSIRSNFLCALGYGDRAALHGRLARPDFTAACGLL